MIWASLFQNFLFFMWQQVQNEKKRWKTRRKSECLECGDTGGLAGGNTSYDVLPRFIYHRIVKKTIPTWWSGIPTISAPQVEPLIFYLHICNTPYIVNLSKIYLRFEVMVWIQQAWNAGAQRLHTYFKINHLSEAWRRMALQLGFKLWAKMMQYRPGFTFGSAVHITWLTMATYDKKLLNPHLPVIFARATLSGRNRSPSTYKSNGLVTGVGAGVFFPA